MTDEVRMEEAEKISGELEEYIGENPTVELPKVESTATKTESHPQGQQPMVMMPDGTRRPATPDEISMFQKTQECGREIQALLDKYNCDLDISMVIGQRGVVPQVQVVPRVPRQNTGSEIVRPDNRIITP
jgi:hypothetical protein